MTDKKNLPFFIFTLAVFVVLILPSLVQDGMFMDGILYAVAAKNLAHGNGTWWNMHINNFTHSSFHEQPPLMFWMESFFFRILGDSIYTERIYSFIGACISAWLIIMIWNLLYEHDPLTRDSPKESFVTYGEIKKISWLPLLLWIVPPVCFWTYSNNLEEISMGIFVLLSAWFILKAVSPSPSGRAGVGLVIVGAVCIFLSSFCKGIQGTFPIAFIGIYWLVYRNFSFMKMIFYSLILIIIPAGIYLLLFTNPVIFQFFKDYYYGRIETAFNASSLYTTDSHFYLLGRLFNELLGPILICLVMFFIIRKKFGDAIEIKPRWKIFWLMLPTGLSGTLPLMVTLEQRRFYLTPSLPFYAIALSSLIAPGAAMLIQRIDVRKSFYRIFKIISIGLLAGAFIFTITRIGKRIRDENMLHDVYAIGKIIPANSNVNMDPAFSDNWSLQLYFTRYFGISLIANNDWKEPYLLMPQNRSMPLAVETKYSEIKIGLRNYRLFKLIKR